MSHGREAARDLHYGRRGGRWAPMAEAKDIQRCVCGRALLAVELELGTCEACTPEDPQPSLF